VGLTRGMSKAAHLIRRNARVIRHQPVDRGELPLSHTLLSCVLGVLFTLVLCIIVKVLTGKADEAGGFLVACSAPVVALVVYSFWDRWEQHPSASPEQ